MLDAVKRFRDGAPALGAHATLPYPQAQIASFEGMLPKGAEWRGFDTVEAQASRRQAQSAA